MRGRFFTTADNGDAPLSVVINETMAARYWPGQEAIGKRFHLGTRDQPWFTIVGIAAQVRHNAVIEPPRAEMYLPHAQMSREVGSTSRGMTVAVKVERGNPLALVGALRESVRALDPNLPISRVRSMERVAADALAQPRFTALLLGVFAALALTLATVGIYGTVALLVSERAHEIGIRMALGAGRGAILGMVLARGVRLAALGVGAGIVAAAGATRLLASMLYGVDTLDPFTFVVAPAMLATVALLACLIPARRAARLDPLETLRQG